MRRVLKNIFAGLCMISCLSGCGDAAATGGIPSQTSSGHTNSQTKTVEDVLAERLSEETPKEGPAEEVNVQETEPEALDPASVSEDSSSSDEITEEVDIDLTSLSATMVYSEVFNMVNFPDDYVGKKIKMSGIMSVYTDEASGKTYYACVIQDATACCAQGIEFALSDKYTDADYPKGGEIVSVTGIFDTYTEGDYVFCTLTDARLN